MLPSLLHSSFPPADHISSLTRVKLPIYCVPQMLQNYFKLSKNVGSTDTREPSQDRERDSDGGITQANQTSKVPTKYTSSPHHDPNLMNTEDASGFAILGNNEEHVLAGNDQTVSGYSNIYSTDIPAASQIDFKEPTDQVQVDPMMTDRSMPEPDPVALSIAASVLPQNSGIAMAGKGVNGALHERNPFAPAVGAESIGSNTTAPDGTGQLSFVSMEDAQSKMFANMNTLEHGEFHSNVQEWDQKIKRTAQTISAGSDRRTIRNGNEDFPLHADRSIQEVGMDADTEEDVRTFHHSPLLIENYNQLSHKHEAHKTSAAVSADDSALLLISKPSYNHDKLANCRLSGSEWSCGDRSATAPPRCTDHYSFMANWPPQGSPRCDLRHRIDVFPPKDAPVHVHIQAYALRWGVWSAEIKDEVRRKEVLEVIADKMKEAWEKAIGDSYYSRPAVQADDSDNRNDSEEKVKKGRKRAISPERQPAGFACDSRDHLAVTNGELAKNKLTMEMIQKRVQERDFQAGEEVLDEVLDSLDRDHLLVKDWTAGTIPSVQGRNLLMYSLFVVLDCRNELRKLKNLLKHFNRESQKRNTRLRIENYQERELQHLALASELHLARREEQSQSVSEEEDDEGNDATSDNGDAEVADLIGDANANIIDQDHKFSTDDQHELLKLAQDVVCATTESALYTAFAVRGLNVTDFDTEGTFQVVEDQALKKAKLILAGILKHVTHLISHKEMTKRQQNPSEKIKMGYDTQLSREKISRDQEQLAIVLNLELKGVLRSPSTVGEPVVSGAKAEIANQAPNGVKDVSHLTTKAIEQRSLLQQRRAGPSAHVAKTGTTSQRKDSSNNNLVGQILKPAQNVSQGSAGKDARQALSEEVQAACGGVSDELAAKRAYIDEKWRPWIDERLRRMGRPPSQVVIEDWRQMRDVIESLGYTTSERNFFLQKFKEQYEIWSKEKEIERRQDTMRQSPTLSTATSLPTPQMAPTNGPPPLWPSDAEILASIPSTGIPANQLLHKFQQRIGQYVRQFGQCIQRLAFMDANHRVYLSQQHATAAHQQFNSQTPGSQHAGSFGSSRPSPLAKDHPDTVKRPHHQPFGVPPAQDESNYPADFKSALVNSTRGFSFRHLPHSTLEQRRVIDDIISEYVSKTAKARKKSYGQYVTFDDPRDVNTPPIAHGFWDHKDGTKPEGSEWFFNGENVPLEWLPKIGIKSSIQSANVDEGNGDGQNTTQQYRDVWDSQRNQWVRLKLASQPSEQPQTHAHAHAHDQDQNQDQKISNQQQQQSYHTSAPGRRHGTHSATHSIDPPSYQNQNQNSSPHAHPTPLSSKHLRQTPATGQTSFSPDSEAQLAVTNRRGTKRAKSVATGRVRRPAKRRRRNTFGDDDGDDEDYVPDLDD